MKSLFLCTIKMIIMMILPCRTKEDKGSNITTKNINVWERKSLNVCKLAYCFFSHRISAYTLVSGVHSFNDHLSSQSCPFYDLVLSVVNCSTNTTKLCPNTNLRGSCIIQNRFRLICSFGLTWKTHETMKESRISGA